MEPIHIDRVDLNWIEFDIDLRNINKDNKTSKYLKDVINYIKLEEEISLFSDITPIGIIEHWVSKCALFYCYYGNKNKMSIYWHFDYEIPVIRFDWGWRDIGFRRDDPLKKKDLIQITGFM